MPAHNERVFDEEKRINPWYEQEYHCKFLETVDSVFTFDQVTAAISNEVEPLDFGSE